jgi:hypothetical protein
VDNTLPTIALWTTRATPRSPTEPSGRHGRHPGRRRRYRTGVRRGRCRGRGLCAQTARSAGRGEPSSSPSTCGTRTPYGSSSPRCPASTSWSTTRAAPRTACSSTRTPNGTRAMIELNLLAPLTASLAAYEQLKRAKGSVVMIGSVSGTRPSPGSAAYGAAKAGLENLARSMAVEWAPDVRVNTLVVGMVRTELSHLHYGGRGRHRGRLPNRPAGAARRPLRRRRAAVFLASDAAAYISGAEPPRPRGRGAARLPGRGNRQQGEVS